MTKIKTVLCMLACLASTTVSASGKASSGSANKDSIRASASASEGRGSGGGFGLGLASFSSLANVTGTSFPGLSLAIDVSRGGTLQIMTAINAISPFNFGLGSEYKHVVAGSKSGGFHVGGGLALGTVTGGAGAANFFLNFNALGGIQFTLAGASNIQFDFDFGFQAGVNLASGAAAVSLGGMSTIYGMSVHYFF